MILVQKLFSKKIHAGMQSFLAEFFGTFCLTFVASGAIIIATLTHGKVDYIARVAAPGLMVLAMIYTIGEISGAHINPAVTLAFAIRRALPWKLVPLYWIAQLAGAFIAAIFLFFVFGNVGHIGATIPHYGIFRAFFMEVILTTFLISVIIGTADQAQLVGNNAGLAVGATIILCGLFADPISGASMNPARSLGPMVVAQEFSNIWIYICGPLIGSLIAVGISYLFHGSVQQEEKKAAKGKK